MEWLTLAIFWLTLGMTESSNNPAKIGDLKNKYHAYGLYQVRQPYLDDVAKSYRKEMIGEFGHILVIKEVLEKDKAQWVVTHYLTKYGNLYTKRTGKKPTLEVLVRIHNGGPKGYVNPKTKRHWDKFTGYFMYYQKKLPKSYWISA